MEHTKLCALVAIELRYIHDRLTDDLYTLNEKDLLLKIGLGIFATTSMVNEEGTVNLVSGSYDVGLTMSEMFLIASRSTSTAIYYEDRQDEDKIDAALDAGEEVELSQYDTEYPVGLSIIYKMYEGINSLSSDALVDNITDFLDNNKNQDGHIENTPKDNPPALGAEAS